jgi:hypothetical protein
VGKDKKRFDETLQESRTKNTNKLRYLKRVQEEQEADDELKNWNPNEGQDDSLPEIP